MKLAHLYETESLALRENILWTQEVQSFFFKILSESPSISEDKITFDGLIFKYELSNEEIDFYENRYVPIGDVVVPNESSIVYRYFDDQEFKLNVREKDIFDFVLDIPNNKLMILGKVGWGKSTVLKYCFFYLIQKNNKLKELIHPIFISLHQELKNSSDRLKSETIEIVFKNYILLPRLKKYVDDIVDISNDQFWNYVANFSEFTDYKRQHKNISKTYEDLKTQNFKINKLRNEIQLNNNDLYLYALKYLRIYLEKKPIIIIDDADKVPINYSSAILDSIRKISENYSVKVIFAVRPNTYNAIFKKNKHLKRIINPAISEFGIPNLLPYLNSRKELLVKYKDHCKGIKMEVNDVEYEKPFAIDFLIGMVDLLIKNENRHFIYSISNGNIRKLTSILKTYFNSDYINYRNLFLRVLIKEFPPNHLPNWLLYIPVITNNHKLYLSDDESSNADEFVINIFSSSVNNDVHPFYILYILKFMEKVEVTSLKVLKEKIIKLFTSKKSTFHNELFKKIFQKVINYGLINSEDVYHIDEPEDIDKISTIKIDSSGRFYLNKMIYIFEYLVYVKDDFHFNNDLYGEIRDALKTDSINQRFIDVNKFIKHLFIMENDLLSRLGKKRLAEYKIYFSPNPNTLFFTKEIFNELVIFNKSNLKYNLNVSTIYNNLDDIENAENILNEKLKTI